jgi:hypothetical protein
VEHSAVRSPAKPLRGPAKTMRSTYAVEREAGGGAFKRLLTPQGFPIPNRVVAKGVQLRLARPRVVMTAQKAQADVLLHRLHYALPGWDAAAERRDAQGEFHAQRSPGKGVG